MSEIMRDSATISGAWTNKNPLPTVGWGHSVIVRRHDRTNCALMVQARRREHVPVETGVKNSRVGGRNVDGNNWRFRPLLRLFGSGYAGLGSAQ